MADKVVIDCGGDVEEGEEREVTVTEQPLTPEEEAQRQEDAQAAVDEDAMEKRLTLARTKLSQSVVTLENAHANWAGLTAAQKDAATRLSVLVSAKLARFVLNRFDVPE